MSETSQTTRQWGKSKQPSIPRQVRQYWYSFSTGTGESFPMSKTRGRKLEWHGVVARGRLSEFVDARASDRMFSERAVCKQLVPGRGGKDAKQAIDETQARFVAHPSTLRCPGGAASALHFLNWKVETTIPKLTRGCRVRIPKVNRSSQPRVCAR